ncbi:hypothetical protein LR948_10085 [Roseivivax sp. GX 12232]|uniref:hypothetical protein n=1 Tax=Roseivivax sp. GX 12232 TaxID=2900547 RepID=UPI001E5FADB4|nr:hypothetical protein [Roseivivax sp. GX 12232]MCE0505704.1 hypothetical protein [Roseivivax sp. GX 12232]
MTIRSKTLGVTALLASTALAAGVQAQTAPDSSLSAPEASSQTSPLGMEAPRAAGGAPETLDALVTAYEDGLPPMAEVSDLPADAAIETMAISDFPGAAPGEAERLDLALADAEGELTEIQDAVAGNAALSDALEAEGYAPEDVIGVFAGSAGTVELLIDDRA